MVRTRRSSSYGRSLKFKDSTGTAKKLSWGDELNLLKSPTGKAGEKQQQQQSNKLKQVAAGGVTKKRNSNGNFNTIDAGKTPGKTLESASARKRRMNARRTSRGVRSKRATAVVGRGQVSLVPSSLPLCVPIQRQQGRRSDWR